MKKLIKEFLEKFCTKVGENEGSATTELYMDDHDCIEVFEGNEYYVPKNNSSYSEDDELLRDFLIYTYGLK